MLNVLAIVLFLLDTAATRLRTRRDVDVCDFCGCPTIDPFSYLTDQHLTLLAVAEAYEESGDPLDLEAVSITWQDHLAAERPAVEHLGRALDLEEVLDRGRGRRTAWR